MGIFDIFKRKEKAYHHVINVTDDDFNVQVIQRSFKQLVMVDFWAAWCQPCLQLGPVLERIAIEPDSKFVLAKIQSDMNQKTAQQFGIQSIPAVKMIRNGQIVGQFQGLQFESNIRRFVDEVDEKPLPPIKIKGGNNTTKRLQMAKSQLKKGRGFEAALLLREFPEGANSAEAAALLPFAELLWNLNDGDALTGKTKLDEAYLDALDALESGNSAESINLLQSVVGVGDSAENERTQQAIVTLQSLTKK